MCKKRLPHLLKRLDYEEKDFFVERLVGGSFCRI